MDHRPVEMKVKVVGEKIIRKEEGEGKVDGKKFEGEMRCEEVVSRRRWDGGIRM